MARELVRVVRGGEGYLYSDGIHWVLRLFQLNQGKPLHLIPWIAPRSRSRTSLKSGGISLTEVVWITV